MARDSELARRLLEGTAEMIQSGQMRLRLFSGRPLAARESLAWAAGIFDGEGYVGTFERKVPSSGRRIPHLNMKVVQWYDPEITDRFLAAVGIGTVNSRIRKDTVHQATEYYWATSGLEHVQAVAAMLWPWLSGPKKHQIARSLEAYHQGRTVIGVRAWRRS
jgi:hypothetical protein